MPFQESSTLEATKLLGATSIFHLPAAVAATLDFQILGADTPVGAGNLRPVLRL
ncbi:MAG TPA: hypothetical protein VL128_11710 [Candidatus Eisenbacteria bacterium]|nr:hypothetical protein [Candidatus Eisenbacteria bacterium]